MLISGLAAFCGDGWRTGFISAWVCDGYPIWVPIALVRTSSGAAYASRVPVRARRAAF